MKTSVALDVEAVRSEFPSLALEQSGRPVVFLDGPGGTQVSRRVIDAITNYYQFANANEGGAFRHQQALRRSRGRGPRRRR
jgi:selenocysteine lyase/cysteine desulfurase